jgi:hypothetical protein
MYYSPEHNTISIYVNFGSHILHLHRGGGPEETKLPQYLNTTYEDDWRMAPHVLNPSISWRWVGPRGCMNTVEKSKIPASIRNQTLQFTSQPACSLATILIELEYLLQITVFWDMMRHSLVGTCQLFIATCYLHLQWRIFFQPEDENRWLPLKAGIFLLNYAASHPQEHLAPKFQGTPFNLQAAQFWLYILLTLELLILIHISFLFLNINGHVPLPHLSKFIVHAQQY